MTTPAAADGLPRIRHDYAGASWMQTLLDARARRCRRDDVGARRMSPLGIAVAEAIGLVWRGIYHLPESLLLRATWDNPYVVTVTVPDGLATFDGGELTWLVVVCHDMLLRLEISASAPRYLRLRFWQRASRDGGMSDRMPTLERHADLLRGHYTIESAIPTVTALPRCPRCSREVAAVSPTYGMCMQCASASMGLYDESEAT